MRVAGNLNTTIVEPEGTHSEEGEEIVYFRAREGGDFLGRLSYEI